MYVLIGYFDLELLNIATSVLYHRSGIYSEVTS